MITGRSDATLNRGGVRLGTSEIYAVVEELPEIVDCARRAPGGHGRRAGELVLFVVPRRRRDVDDACGRSRRTLRTQLSPRHVPDTIVAVPAIRAR